MKEILFSNDIKKNRVTFQKFIDYLEKSSSFDYSKQEYKHSLDVFDYGKNGQANISDIERSLQTYSNLNQGEIEHYLKMNLINEDKDFENA